MSLRDKIKRALEDNELGTISTVNQADNKPQSALIAFVENDDLELFFQTSNKTRKYSNLLSNNNAAFVIGFGLVNLQYEGSVEALRGKDEIESIKQLFAEKGSPTTQHYLDLPDTVIFKVTPQWIGYRNYDEHPPVIAELRF